MTILWPQKALPATSFAMNPAPRNARGGSSVSGGISTVSASDAGYWVATMGNVSIRDANGRKLWRALQVMLEGGLTPILIPTCADGQPGYAVKLPAVPHSDGAYFSDNTGYVSGKNSVTLSASAPRRAAQLSIAIAYTSAPLEPGMQFSIGERLYRIRQIIDDTTIKIWPPLREAVSAGDYLEFDYPVCRMRLASDSAMDIEFELRRFGNPSVQFVEDL